jgi:hypothetical protein
MLKTISAALLAASVLAGPALAASSGKIDTTRATKTMTDKAAAARTTVTAPKTIKPMVLSADAKMHTNHVQHARHHRHHNKMADRHHKKVAVGKVKSKVSYKPAVSTTKRG